MSYIFKKGEKKKKKKVVGDDPSLMRENQIVESVKKNRCNRHRYISSWSC